MEKLFESGDYDATYTDDEGITPLHVCPVLRTALAFPFCFDGLSFLTAHVCC
ncbi:hypothetical protein BR93DRAFT_932074 [Coniochaeta sp. PMI_546]|nr:hypothetical protein BR93DRAFT_932074 [Coniochaeta sp. PMI_546]